MSFFHLTKLPPLTYLLIIEEYCPQASPRGHFRFPHIADPDHVAGHVARARWHARYAPNENNLMDLVFAPSQIETWPLDRLRPYARNAKIHGTDQVAKIAASMAKFGWTVPCMVADDGELIAGHGLILSAASGGGQHALGTGDAPGLVGLVQGRAHGPDGDIVEVQPVPVSGFQRLNEEVLGSDLKDQRLRRVGFGFGRLCHGLVSDPGVIS